jgi:hypothetical protein
MHTRTQRHEKPAATQPEGRKFAAKIGRAAVKTGRFFGALLGIGAIATSLSIKDAPAQTPASTHDRTPPDKQTQIIMAAKGELPANTYVAAPAPATDGEGKKAAGGGTSLEPEPNPNQMTFGDKFCETTVEKDVIKIRITIGNNTLSYELPGPIFENIGLPNANEKDIAIKCYDKAHGTIHFITEKGTLSLTLDLQALKKVKSINGKCGNDTFKGVELPGNKSLFIEKTDFYVSKDGSKIFTASPDGFIIIKPEYQNYFPWSSFGKKLPLENPTIDTEYYMGKELIRIRDPTMVKDNGNYYKILFDMETLKIGQFEMPLQPLQDNIN